MRVVCDGHPNHSGISGTTPARSIHNSTTCCCAPHRLNEPVLSDRTTILVTMTIIIERNALLTVLSRTPLHQPHRFHAHPIEDDEWVEVSYPKEQPSSSVESYDDDCCSLSSTDCSTLSNDRRVSFADSLVTEIKECPRTPIEDVPSLFYSTEQLSR